jgi:adenine-specific DNA methylase
MYERMLDKQFEPSFDDLLSHSGERADLWLTLDTWFIEEFSAKKLIRFPYGNDYGWAVKYSRKSKHICDVFAENGAFSVFFKVDESAVEKVYDDLGDYAKTVWKEAYPCKNGGWIDFRVLNAIQLEDIKKIICAKMKATV